MIDESTLARIEIFRGLNDEARTALCRHAVARKHSKGAVLWRAGKPSRGLYVLLDGRVRVLQTRSGRQHVVHTEGPGATLGEVPLLDGAGYPATCIAATAGECLVVQEDAMRAAVRADPDFAWRLLEGLGSRVRQLVARLQRNTFATVRSRLASSLLAEATDREGLIRREGTQESWAEDLDTVREVLARELAKMKQEGVIASDGGGTYRVLDEEALERILKESE
jgi:CRP-like cAMP-binding protein